MRIHGLSALLVLLLLVPTASSQITHDMVDAEVALGPVETAPLGKRMSVSRVSDPVQVPFTGIAVEIGSTARMVEVDVRFSSNDGVSWTDWEATHVTASPAGGTFLAGLYRDEVISASKYEIRVLADPASITIIRESGVFDNTRDVDRNVPEGLVAIAGKTTGDIIPPPLITRSEWGAASFKGGSPSPLTTGAFRFMTFHHAAGWSATTRAEGIAAVKAIQDFHQNGRGWSDIGYQFLIDRGGRLYQGRPFLDGATSLDQVPLLALGAHVGGANTGNIGIAILGCYHPPEGSQCAEQITPEALNTYITLFAFLSERYGIEPELIRGHRDFSSTACPGDNNYVLLPEVRTDVVQLLIDGNAPIGAAAVTAAEVKAGNVHLSWDVLDTGTLASIIIERSIGGSTTAVAELDPESGTFVDATAPADVEISYSIVGRSVDGRRQELASVVVNVDSPLRFTLTSAWPNPTTNDATFRYFAPHDGFVRIHLFDAAGRQIRVLQDGFLDGGSWHTTSVRVDDLPGGVYFYRMRVDGFSGTVFDKTRQLIVR